MQLHLSAVPRRRNISQHALEIGQGFSHLSLLSNFAKIMRVTLFSLRSAAE